MNDPGLTFSLSYIALVGSPNSGKSSLFNLLTGGRQKVANYPGVTVERKEGRIKTAAGPSIKILDLPGTYSLQATTLDEAVTRDVLLKGHFEKIPPSLLVAVADATNLERSLGLVLELRELGIPTLLALNMMDLANRRGFNINLKILSKELGIPVIPTVAKRKRGVGQLREEIEKKAKEFIGAAHGTPKVSLGSEYFDRSPKDRLQGRFKEIDRILAAAQMETLQPHHWTEKIDRFVLHPIWGTVLLYAVLALIFQGIFNWATYPMDWIEQGVTALGAWVRHVLPEGFLRSLLVEGVLAGVGSVIIFLPQILFLFFIILLLEDSGYMARAAFLMDRHMRRVGLHGRAFLPLLSSFACAIPGIMSTRTMEHKRDRIVTILVAPLMACSARIPVYTLLIAAFIPNKVLWGPFRLQGMVMLFLYLIGAIVGFVMAWGIRKIFFRGPAPAFLLELPTYKVPNFRNICSGMFERAKIFLRRAGTIILAAAVVLWFLSSYPKPPEGRTGDVNPITYSAAGRFGKIIEPVIKPLGFDWSIGIGLLTGVVAREVIVSSLATIYSVEAGDEGLVQNRLSEIIQSRWSVATGLSLLVFFVFAMQCLSTLAVVRRETNSWRWPVFMFTYLTALAYGFAFLTYRITNFLIS